MSVVTLNILADAGLRGNRLAAICALDQAVPRSATVRSEADRTDAEWDEIMSRLYSVAYPA